MTVFALPRMEDILSGRDIYSITSSLKGEVTLVPVNPSWVKRLMASLHVGASSRVYVCSHSPYAALKRAGLLECEIGFPISENFAIMRAKLQIIPLAEPSQIDDEYGSIYK